MSIHVLKQGLQTTVQDFGRPGYAHLGISTSGAADAFSYQIGNKLVGNDPHDAALEITLSGGEYEFTSDACIALTGSEFNASVDDEQVSIWTRKNINKEQLLKIRSSQDGARCYLCVRGGIDVPILLNSRSTHLMTGLGGYEGRALRKGNVLDTYQSGDNNNRVELINVNEILKHLDRKIIRVIKTMEGDWFNEDVWDLFLNENFTVSQSFSRMGIRLEGNHIQSSQGNEILTQGVPLGAIQVPGSGNPIISFVEHQTTGGYPCIANVISADLCRVGQLKPGDTFQFELVNFEAAEQLYNEQMKFIHNLSAS